MERGAERDSGRKLSGALGTLPRQWVQRPTSATEILRDTGWSWTVVFDRSGKTTSPTTTTAAAAMRTVREGTKERAQSRGTVARIWKEVASRYYTYIFLSPFSSSLFVRKKRASANCEGRYNETTRVFHVPTCVSFSPSNEKMSYAIFSILPSATRILTWYRVNWICDKVGEVTISQHLTSR